MLGQICQYLRNWFDEDSRHNRLPSWSGEITIADGKLVGFSDKLLSGQYFRIIDSALNDGIYQYGADTLSNETFDGTVQSMRVPPDIVALDAEIEAWQEKYGGVDSAAMSPYSSESETVGSWSHSVSKSAGASGGSSGTIVTWQSVFAAQLGPWRKI